MPLNTKRAILVILRQDGFGNEKIPTMQSDSEGNVHLWIRRAKISVFLVKLRSVSCSLCLKKT
jgi:hypothetical protein